MKKDIFLKIEYIEEMPEEDRMSTEIYDPRDIIITGWYKDRPNVMIDRQLMIEFPELKTQLVDFTKEEPCEGTLIVYSSNPIEVNSFKGSKVIPVTKEYILGILNTNGWDARIKMTIN